MRILLISLGALLFLVIALATTHFWGLSQFYQPYENGFFDSPRPWKILSWESLPENETPSTVVWIDVIRTQDQTLLGAPLEFAYKIAKSQWPQAASAQTPALVDLLQKFSQRRVILNILANVDEIDRQIADLIGEKGSGRFLIQSDFDVVLTSIKSLRPLLAYGATPADRMRFLSFQSMGILTATPFKGDVFVSPLFHQKVSLVNAGILQELRRRYKKIILGPLQTPEEIQQAQALGADGYLFSKNP